MQRGEVWWVRFDERRLVVFTPCTWLTTVSRDDLMEREAVLSSAKLSEIDAALQLAGQAQERTPATTAKLSEIRGALRLGELG
ncbi:hypothetical protein ACIOD0_11865 [Kitasatospora albolonga]